MRSEIRALVSVSAFVVGLLATSGQLAAQSSDVDCSKPLSQGSNEWMNTTVDVTGAKGVNTFTVDKGQIAVRESIGNIWLAYSFQAKDIKGIDKGFEEDNVVTLSIDVKPFQFSNNRGETAAPAGIERVTVDVPAELADAAVNGLQFLRQQASCGK